MLILEADKSNLEVLQKELVTSGSANVYSVEFGFNEDWNEIDRVAVFTNGTEIISIPLDETNQCQVPWEVMKEPNKRLKGGVFGTKGETVVLPTIWADLGVIQQGVTMGAEPSAPTPDAYQKILGMIGEMAGLTTEHKDTLVGAINEANRGGSGGGIASDEISTIRVLDLAEYEALPTKDAKTLYFIRG